MSDHVIFQRVYFFSAADLTTQQLERAGRDAAQHADCGRVVKISSEVVSINELRRRLHPGDFQQVLLFRREGLQPVLVTVEAEPLQFTLNITVGEPS